MNNILKYGLVAVAAVSLLAFGYMKYNESDNRTPKERLNEKNANSTSVSDDTKTSVNNKTAVNSDTKKTSVNADNKKLEPLIATGDMTSLQFDEMKWNYGDVDQGSSNTHIFKFTNTGTKPLIISAAQGSCGCTVPSYPKYPVAPGKSDQIEVTFKPKKGQEGITTKTVSITANTEPKVTKLEITANVAK